MTLFGNKGQLDSRLQCLWSGPHLDGCLGESLSPPSTAHPLSPTGGSHLGWQADVLFTVKDTELDKGGELWAGHKAAPQLQPQPLHSPGEL